MKIFYKVFIPGQGSCVFDSLNDLLEDIKIHLLENNKVKLEIIKDEMEEYKYEALPEFQGW